MSGQMDAFDIYCTRCGCPRPKTEHPCPQCNNPEFTHNAKDPTAEGWKKRQKKTNSRRK